MVLPCCFKCNYAFTQLQGGALVFMIGPAFAGAELISAELGARGRV
jgi:hypothetical protein